MFMLFPLIPVDSSDLWLAFGFIFLLMRWTLKTTILNEREEKKTHETRYLPFRQANIHKKRDKISKLFFDKTWNPTLKKNAFNVRAFIIVGIFLWKARDYLNNYVKKMYIYHNLFRQVQSTFTRQRDRCLGRSVSSAALFISRMKKKWKRSQSLRIINKWFLPLLAVYLWMTFSIASGCCLSMLSGY